MNKKTIIVSLYCILLVSLLLTAISIREYLNSPDYLRVGDAGSLSPKIVINIDGISQNDEGFFINGWAIFKGKENEKDSKKLVFLDMSDKRKNYLLKTEDILREDVTTYYKNKINYDYSGFSMFLPKNELPKGTYRIGVQITADKGQYYIMSKDEIKID